MDFTVLDDLAAYREAARSWVDENVQQEWVDEQHRTGTHHTPELHALLARDGILGAGWPPEYGGSQVDPDFARAVFREIDTAGLLMHGWGTTVVVLRTIEQVGTEEQKQDYIHRAMRGDLLIALGYTEPDSGSDVAAAKTTAVRDGDEWIISGQKMFTSTAQSCSHVFVLARTNPEAPKHNGLTLFMVPTDSPGYELQPIHTLGGQRTNATFYTEVRIPDSARIGGIDEGWKVMKVALVFERGAGSPRPPDPTLARDVARWAARSMGEDGSRRLDAAQVAERIGRIAVEERVARLLELRMQWKVERGELSGVEGSMSKLFKSESAQRHFRDILDLLGPEGVLASESGSAPEGGRFEQSFRSSVVQTIYGGSSEIMREIIAEGRLGLPRGRSKP
jgi:alkylation response protein AidB-like acyl-CoA dehydrogenase